MSINEFLSHNPTVTEILQWVESEAQRIAAERNAGSGINAK